MDESISLLAQGGKQVFAEIHRQSCGLLLPDQEYIVIFGDDMEYSIHLKTNRLLLFRPDLNENRFPQMDTRWKRQLKENGEYELLLPAKESIEGYDPLELQVVSAGDVAGDRSGGKGILELMWERMTSTTHWRDSLLGRTFTQEKWIDNIASKLRHWESAMALGQGESPEDVKLVPATLKGAVFDRHGVVPPIRSIHQTEREDKSWSELLLATPAGLFLHTHTLEEDKSIRYILCPSPNEIDWFYRHDIAQAIFADRPDENGTFLGVVCAPKANVRWNQFNVPSTANILNTNFHWSYVALSPEGGLKRIDKL